MPSSAALIAVFFPGTGVPQPIFQVLGFNFPTFLHLRKQVSVKLLSFIRLVPECLFLTPHLFNSGHHKKEVTFSVRICSTSAHAVFHIRESHLIAMKVAHENGGLEVSSRRIFVIWELHQDIVEHLSRLLWPTKKLANVRGVQPNIYICCIFD